LRTDITTHPVTGEESEEQGWKLMAMIKAVRDAVYDGTQNATPTHSPVQI
jgi:hypothetical protein